jgi:hypothetical protein
VREILEARPGGLSEYDLIRELRDRGVPPFAPVGGEEPGAGGDAGLALFRSHFFLFHVLYLMRCELRRISNLDIHIFCLDIRLIPWRQPETDLPALPDPLEEYYLDWSNYEEADADTVRELLAEAEGRIRAWINREEHLRVLGLSDPVDDREILERYRRLSRIHHPDAGGSAEAFARIQSAVQALRT